MSQTVGPSRYTAATGRLSALHIAADKAVADNCTFIRDPDNTAMSAVAINRADDVDSALATLYRGVFCPGRNASGKLS